MLSLSWAAVAATVVSVVSAQNAIPTNGTVPDDATNGSPLELRYTNPADMMTTTVDLLPAWALNSSGLENVTDTETISLSGQLILTNTSNYNSLLTRGDFAFISCDPDIYEEGNIDLPTVINAATGKVEPSGGSDTLDQTQGGGIILYSKEAQWCNFTKTGGYSYRNVFTLVNRNTSNGLYNNTISAHEPFTAAIMSKHSFLPPTNNTDNGDDGNDDNGSPGFGPQPTTTIAMVILYIITGIITLMFIVIIIAGAIRAHRHPERYRQRTLMGRPIEGSRARGIAAGILDTLPIVKFGERDARKDATGVATAGQSTDVELQDTTTPRSAVAGATASQGGSAEAPMSETEASHGANATIQPTTSTPEISPEASADAGLACSVCTDDFVKGQDTRVLPCNHKFHPECIDPWLLNVSGTCPLCRVELHAPDAARSGSSTSANASSEEDGAPPRRDPSPGTSQNGSAPRDRRSAFGVIHRALNRTHMSRATPEQRLEALRDLRNANRDTGEAATGEETEGSSRVRLVDRARRAVRWERTPRS